MRKLGWSQETIDAVLSMIAGLLHLGQIKFKEVEVEGTSTAEVDNERSMLYAAKLLGVDCDQLRCALTQRIILARGEQITTRLTPDRANDARDALAKTVYGALFLWVVDQVNKSIGWENDSDIRSSCGVLDIFGFECFAVNSFEQLCINYTNEALQQQFNQFIFKLEQAEYEAENIEWAFIEFPDNQDCLDTIQASKVGILAILDDECRLPKGSDRNFAKRMYEYYLPEKNMTVSANTRIHATMIQQAKALFCIRHFAGLVEYNADTNFMEKNKDEIPITAKNMFETAPTDLIKAAFAVQTRENLGRAATETEGRAASKQKTVGQQFKEQLSELIESVQKTDPHYIRCIKPNDAAKPLLMTRKRTTEQLRYGGVLEAVRVARAGYPVRLPHAAFYQRYRMILPTLPDKVLPWSLEGHEPQQLCVRLVECALEEGTKHQEAISNGPLDPAEAGITRSEKIRRMQNQPIDFLFPKSDVQLGKSKVFMRKHPHDCLEAHRVFHQSASATIIQCWARGLAMQRKFLIIQSAVEIIQRCYRGKKGRERYVYIDFYCGQLTRVFFSNRCQFFSSVSLDGGKFEENLPETYLLMSFVCSYNCANTVNCEKEPLGYKLRFADAINDERMRPSKWRNITADTLPSRSSKCSNRPSLPCNVALESERPRHCSSISSENKKMLENSNRTTKNSKRRWQVYVLCLPHRRNKVLPTVPTPKNWPRKRSRLPNWRNVSHKSRRN